MMAVRAICVREGWAGGGVRLREAFLEPIFIILSYFAETFFTCPGNHLPNLQGIALKTWCKIRTVTFSSLLASFHNS
jgi:hypothetical protein